MYESEMEAFRDHASPKLVRSETGTLGELNTGLIRTSKQAWMADRFFNFKSKTGNLTTVLAMNEGEPPPLPYQPEKDMNITNAAAFRVSQRIQNATELNLWRPFAAESYQVSENEAALCPQNFHLNVQKKERNCRRELVAVSANKISHLKLSPFHQLFNLTFDSRVILHDDVRHEIGQ